MYTAEILKCLRHCTGVAYADDTQILYRFPTELAYTVMVNINEDLGRLQETVTQHHLKLNSNKSYYMLFGLSASLLNLANENFSIEVNDSPLIINLIKFVVMPQS